MARKTDQMKCDFDAQQVFGEIVKTIKKESEMIRSGSPDSLRAIREALAEIIKEDALLEKRRTNERLKEKELKREEDAYNKELRTSLHQMHSREAVGLGRRRGGDEPGARRTSVFGKLGGVLAGAGATLAAGVGLTSIANRVAGEAKEPPTDRPQSSSRPNLLETGLGATIVQTIRQESEMIRSGSPDSLRTIREALMEMSTREQNVNTDLQRKETEREQTADNEAIISQLGNISDTLKGNEQGCTCCRRRSKERRRTIRQVVRRSRHRCRRHWNRNRRRSRGHWTRTQRLDIRNPGAR